MDRPICSVLFASAVLALAARAAEVGLPASASPAAEAVAPSPPSSRAVSPHVAELLAASRPKELLPAVAERPLDVARVALPESAKPANEIVRLPRYLVREPKLPAPMEVMTKGELERYAMKRYLGPEDGLDRGFLNLFTIAGVWKKIPVLKYFPFITSETNEDRALRLHEAAERKRKMEELGSLMNFKEKPAEPPKDEK